MTQTLPQVGHEHHARILAMVDGFPALADALVVDDGAGHRDELVAAQRFLAGTLLPHVEASERAVYPELERLFQNRHSMAPMRREHQQIRRLVGQFGTIVSGLDDQRIGIGRVLRLRRVLFQLYALLKVHLAEEEEYLRIVDHGVPDDVGEVLAAAMEHAIA